MIHVPNEAALRAGIEHAEQDLNAWDQGEWVNDCGTTACLAGHILLAAGYSMQDLVAIDKAPAWSTRQGEPRMHASVPKLALDLLGLPEDDRFTFQNRIFGATHHHQDDVRLALDPGAFKLFKELITRETGIEF